MVEMSNQEGPTTCLETGQPLEITLKDLDDEELAEELDRMVSENYYEKRYMPSKWIEAYTSEAVVKSILGSRYEPPLVPDLVLYVLHSPAKKLLLLLALCQALHCLPAMKNFGLKMTISLSPLSANLTPRDLYGNLANTRGRRKISLSPKTGIH